MVGVGVGIRVQIIDMAVLSIVAFDFFQIVQQIRQRTNLAGGTGHTRRFRILELFLQHIDDPMRGWVVVMVLMVVVVPGSACQTQPVRTDRTGGQVDVVLKLWRVFVQTERRVWSGVQWYRSFPIPQEVRRRNRGYSVHLLLLLLDAWID